LPGGTTGCDFGAADFAGGGLVPGVFVAGGGATLLLALLLFVEEGAVFVTVGGATGCITGADDGAVIPGDPAEDALSSVAASDARTCPATWLRPSS
jgi:hypothetical protein